MLLAATEGPLVPWLDGVPASVGLLAVAVGAVVLYLVTRFGVLRLVAAAAARTRAEWDDRFLHHRAPNRLALVPPAVFVHLVIDEVQGLATAAAEPLARVAAGLIVLSVMWALFGALDAVNDLYEEHADAAARSIKSYIQLAKLILTLIAGVLVVAFLAGRSPVLLLSGLGAATAVLLLIFRDTILSLVASVQLATNDMIEVGDWITIEGMGVDGVIADMALHTVTVRQFDETYAFVPTHKLKDEPFRNWRGMIQSGARRFQCVVHVDARSVRPVDGELRSDLAEDALVGDLVDGAATNLALFRAHLDAWMRERDDVVTDGRFPMLVRMLEASPSGIPIEVYAFATTTAWVEYEAIRAEVTEHMHTAPLRFGLRVHQFPTGDDLAAAGIPIE